MSRSTGNRSAAPRKSGNPLLTGILIGMVIGVSMAAALAWYITKSPSPFVQKEQVIAKTPVDIPKPPTGNAKPAPPSGTAISEPPTTSASSGQALPASGVVGGKPRFEFYKVLTDKQDATVTVPPKPTEKSSDKPQPAKPKTVESKTVAANESYFLQAGSFSNADDADKLKARLAMLGFESSTQTATIPDKGVWHRVRTGPYKNTEEMNRARNLLKQNGVDATPMRAQ
ncbi:MAG: SPOR domain-containing protein [Gallionella sp.]|nr:SPOR domain-containing protein [Gallionella sp.]